ncbi:hypothetical protein J6590_025552 [Homalodisca vitripennis]|nr:hypothetical protein J6590_025552 [Homalodisca vitripennis]
MCHCIFEAFHCANIDSFCVPVASPPERPSSKEDAPSPTGEMPSISRNGQLSTFPSSCSLAAIVPASPSKCVLEPFPSTVPFAYSPQVRRYSSLKSRLKEAVTNVAFFTYQTGLSLDYLLVHPDLDDGINSPSVKNYDLVFSVAIVMPRSIIQVISRNMIRLGSHPSLSLWHQGITTLHDNLQHRIYVLSSPADVESSGRWGCPDRNSLFLRTILRYSTCLSTFKTKTLTSYVEHSAIRLEVAKTKAPKSFRHLQPPINPTFDLTNFYTNHYQKPPISPRAPLGVQ